MSSGAALALSEAVGTQACVLGAVLEDFRGPLWRSGLAKRDLALSRGLGVPALAAARRDSPSLFMGWLRTRLTALRIDL